MLYTNVMDGWILGGVFVVAVLVVFVTWAFTTLGKPPNEEMWARLDDMDWQFPTLNALAEPAQPFFGSAVPAVSIEPRQGARPSSLSGSHGADIGAADNRQPAAFLEAPSIVVIEMNLAHVPPEDLSEMYGEHKHCAPSEAHLAVLDQIKSREADVRAFVAEQNQTLAMG